MLTKEITTTYRNFRGEADFPIIVDIINGCKKVDSLEWTTSVVETANDFKHMERCDPYEDVIFAEVAGETVGYGRCWWRKQLDGTHIYTSFALLLPEWRGQGIRRNMLRQMESRLRQIGATHPPEHEKYLQAWTCDTETHWTQLLENEGYKIIRYEFDMARPNLENIPDCPLPEGLTIRNGSSDEVRPIWDAAREAFRDHWGASEWSDNDLAGWQAEPTFQPHLWQVAWDGDEVAGGVLNYINAAENEEYGRKRGYTETIFVRKPWRGQKLAQALIAHSFATHKEAGMTEAALGVDAENPTGALHLYRKMGFEETKRFMTYRKPIREIDE